MWGERLELGERHREAVCGVRVSSATDRSRGPVRDRANKGI